MEQMPDLQVQIIFTVTSREEDEKAPPVRHFLAIKEQYDEQTLDRALSEWYGAAEKNYDSFAAKYPVTGALQKHDHQLDAMTEWCMTNDIAYTPTIFVNGHELPDMYEIADLKHLLT